MIDWEAIVAQYGRLVWATAYRLVDHHADAADCFQEVFLDAFRMARQQPVRDWPSLLRHLATARALDHLRARCRRRGRTDAQADPACLPSQESGPDLAAEASELAERLRMALAQLPEQQAEVFCLSCMDKLSYGQIGERLKLTTSAVGVLLHRARQRLKELLEPGDDAERHMDRTPKIQKMSRSPTNEERGFCP